MKAAVAASALLLTGLLGSSRADEPPPAAALLQDLRSFNELGCVLHVAAHPDDENTALLTYLARGKGCRTAYLSITRGDGGQNLLGPEFGETLGVLRTQELLAARKLDGARQFFTRAIDFGFSKDAYKTLSIWDKEQVLGDVVRVIRTFRPDVIVTRFSTVPGGTHGHHTASAILAVEAFKMAGDSKAYPEQLTQGLTRWQPKRIVMNGGKGGGGLRLDIGGTDPTLGMSFGEIAGRSRAMHKTQGFGGFGGGKGGGAKTESFQLLDGLPGTKDLFEGIDTTWARVKDGAEIGTLTQKAIAQFNVKDPAASVPALLEIRSKLSGLLAGDTVVDEKRHQLDRIVAGCLGLMVETTVPQAEVVPGESLKMRHMANVRSSVPVRWVAVRYPSLSRAAKDAIDLQPGKDAVRELTQTLPATTPLSQPYWLRAEHSEGMFKVADPTLIGRPENLPVLPVEFEFEVGGQTLTIVDLPVQILTGGKTAVRRRLEVIPPVALSFESQVELFVPGATKTVAIAASALRPNVQGDVRLDVPANWKVEPAAHHFQLSAVDERQVFQFKVSAPTKPTTGGLEARVQVGGATFGNQRVEIRYDHLPPVLLQPNARVKAVALDLEIAGKKVGYLPGAGDSVAGSLKQMGFSVIALTGADLTPQKLRDFDAVVIGVRAFNTRTDLAERMAALFDFVESGGNVVVQYNKPNGLQTNKIAPFDLRVGPDRVTDKDSKMTFLAPDHPAMNTPNKITAADFEGWVQERGLYFASSWDKRFTPLVACNDPGDIPQKGSLLIAQHGRGYFVYTSLSWFRQLPEGVPGAYRIFANLVSLGKK
jgi:LmbE family N-acetylglucosaminyl deacetylase